MKQGDIIDCVTAGGGGYGDPLTRESSAVLEDVLDHRVSVTAAAGDYGVVLDGRLNIDEPATRQLRKKMQAVRGPITWTFDRGELGRS